jgi:hypothetical protein
MCRTFLAGLGIASTLVPQRRWAESQSLGHHRARRQCRESCSLATPTSCRSRDRPESTNPFKLEKREGNLYRPRHGRYEGLHRLLPDGSRDGRLPSKLHTPIHLAFSYDEEIGCVGVRRMLDILKDAPVKPRLCIVGEPTLMQAVTAHKGKLGFRVSAHGLEAHSSLAPIGVNAIYMASDLISAIRAIQKDIAENGIRMTATTKWPTPRCMWERCRAVR